MAVTSTSQALLHVRVDTLGKTDSTDTTVTGVVWIETKVTGEVWMETKVCVEVIVDRTVLAGMIEVVVIVVVVPD